MPISSNKNRVYFDSHMHTPLCKHARGEPEEYAEVGRRIGLRGIIVTCHGPGPEGFAPHVRMGMDELPRYVAMVDRAARQFTGEGFSVRLGLESDYLPGMESWAEALHGMADFHYVLGSLHCMLREYRGTFYKGDVRAFELGYFNHLADAAETGLFDCLAHPDLVKNEFPETWNFEDLRDGVVRALDRIAAAGTAMELNTSGVFKRYPEENPGPEMLRMMAEREIPVVLSSDSHVPERVGDGFPEGLRTLSEAGFADVSYFEDRRRVDVPIREVAASLGVDLEAATF